MSIKHVSVDTPFIYGKKTRNSVKSVICIENIWFPFTVLKICSMTELYGIEFKCRRFIVTQQMSITEQQGMQPFKSGGIHPFDPHVDHIQFVLFTKYLNLIVYWECQRSALFIFHNCILFLIKSNQEFRTLSLMKKMWMSLGLTAVNEHADRIIHINMLSLVLSPYLQHCANYCWGWAVGYLCHQHSPPSHTQLSSHPPILSARAAGSLHVLSRFLNSFFISPTNIVNSL